MHAHAHATFSCISTGLLSHAPVWAYADLSEHEGLRAAGLFCSACPVLAAWHDQDAIMCRISRPAACSWVGLCTVAWSPYGVLLSTWYVRTVVSSCVGATWGLPGVSRSLGCCWAWKNRSELHGLLGHGLYGLWQRGGVPLGCTTA